MPHRITLGVLYALLFFSFCLLGVAVRIAHWIADNVGLTAMLACVVTYFGIILGLVWAINRINKAFPTLDLPPSSKGSGQIWDMAPIYDEVGITTAVEKSPPGKLTPEPGKPAS